MMRAVGLDIGTTTICALVLDIDTGILSESITQPSEAEITGSHNWMRMQNPNIITNCCSKILNHLLDRYDDVIAVGISGQMHGMLYLDAKGNPLGSLRTWQDGRGALMTDNGVSYAEAFTQAVGLPSASGYGLVTLFYDSENGLTPQGAQNICTIGDLVVMSLCGNVKPLLHASNASGMGGFDLTRNSFLLEKLPDTLDNALLPEVLKGESIIGEYRGIPVCCAIGDNQASVMGSLGPGVNALINIGTGSQISAVCEKPFAYDNSLECRPYVGGKFLSVGAALCGGYAYYMLREFFAQTAEMLGAAVPKNLYSKMDDYAERARREQNQLVIDTRFSGTRQNPQLRGSISNIDTDNLTPGKLCLGILEGICDELLTMSKLFDPPLQSGQTLAGAGNGIRHSSVTRAICQECFGMRLALPRCPEEAAYGAALISAVAARKIKLKEARALVKYNCT